MTAAAFPFTTAGGTSYTPSKSPPKSRRTPPLSAWLVYMPRYTANRAQKRPRWRLCAAVITAYIFNRRVYDVNVRRRGVPRRLHRKPQPAQEGALDMTIVKQSAAKKLRAIHAERHPNKAKLEQVFDRRNHRFNIIGKVDEVGDGLYLKSMVEWWERPDKSIMKGGYVALKTPFSVKDRERGPISYLPEPCVDEIVVACRAPGYVDEGDMLKRLDSVRHVDSGDRKTEFLRIARDASLKYPCEHVELERVVELYKSFGRVLTDGFDDGFNYDMYETWRESVVAMKTDAIVQEHGIPDDAFDICAPPLEIVGVVIAPNVIDMNKKRHNLFPFLGIAPAGAPLFGNDYLGAEGEIMHVNGTINGVVCRGVECSFHKGHGEIVDPLGATHSQNVSPKSFWRVTKRPGDRVEDRRVARREVHLGFIRKYKNRYTGCMRFLGWTGGDYRIGEPRWEPILR